MFSSPFDHTVGFAAVALDDVSEQMLHPAERELLNNTTHPEKLYAFTAGRYALREALSSLGESVLQPILRGERGEPLGPAGYLLTLAHSSDWAVAAVSHERDNIVLGIDLERLVPKRRVDLSKRICVGEELNWAAPDPIQTLRVFAAKEAIYKAFSPKVKRYIGFREVELSSDGEGLHATLPQDLGAVVNSERISLKVDRIDDYLLASLQVRRSN